MCENWFTLYLVNSLVVIKIQKPAKQWQKFLTLNYLLSFISVFISLGKLGLYVKENPVQFNGTLALHYLLKFTVYT